MIDLISKPNRRQCFPVELDDRKAHVRSMKLGELKRLDALAKEHKTGFVMGVCLTDENGVPAFAKNADESDAEFSDRVMAALDDADVDSLVIGKLSQAIGKIGKVDVEMIQKN